MASPKLETQECIKTRYGAIQTNKFVINEGIRMAKGVY